MVKNKNVTSTQRKRCDWLSGWIQCNNDICPTYLLQKVSPCPSEYFRPQGGVKWKVMVPPHSHEHTSCRGGFIYEVIQLVRSSRWHRKKKQSTKNDTTVHPSQAGYCTADCTPHRVKHTVINFYNYLSTYSNVQCMFRGFMFEDGTAWCCSG